MRRALKLVAICCGMVACAAGPKSGAGQGASALLAPLPLTGLDDGLTPRERAARWQALPGVFETDNPRRCSASAARRAVGPKWLGGDTLVSKTVLGQVVSPTPARNHTSSMIEVADAALAKLRENRDPHAGSRQVCLGLYDYGEVNARSYPDGYIAVDKRIIERMFSLPEKNRSMMSIDLVVLHELAHQLQFWWGNPFLNDKTVRRSELAADCVASSLLRTRWMGLPLDTWRVSEVGVIGAAENLGDFEFELQQHHGTPDERRTAALYGISAAVEAAKEPKLGAGPTGRELLENCNRFITERDSQSPGGLWPPYALFKQEVAAKSL